MKCGAFDSGLTIHPDGKITPCCLFDLQYSKNFNSVDWKDPWQDLRDGRGCNACKKSGPTYRDVFDLYFNDEFAVRYLDVRNNNLCNMECVICGPYYSSKWAERLNRDQKYVNTDFEIDLSQLQRVYFAGGEPFLNKTHWDILEKIPNPKNVGLVYSSNLTYIKNIEQHWKKFNDVFINASLDGIGNFGEQMRPGLNWEKWQKNLDEILKISNVNVEIAVTVNALNIWYLKEIKDYADSKKVSVKFYKLYKPEHLCVNTIPLELREKIDYVPTVELQETLNEDCSHLFKHTVANVLLGDQTRRTNLWDYMPFKSWAIKNILE